MRICVISKDPRCGWQLYIGNAFRDWEDGLVAFAYGGVPDALSGA